MGVFLVLRGREKSLNGVSVGREALINRIFLRSI